MRLKHIRTCLWMTAVAVIMSGCVVAPFQPPMGSYTDISAPLSLEHRQSRVESLRRGEASAHCVLGLVAWGDSGTQAAARQGGLKTVEYLDYKYLNIIGIYQKATVYAYGE